MHLWFVLNVWPLKAELDNSKKSFSVMLSEPLNILNSIYQPRNLLVSRVTCDTYQITYRIGPPKETGSARRVTQT